MERQDTSWRAAFSGGRGSVRAASEWVGFLNGSTSSKDSRASVWYFQGWYFQGWYCTAMIFCLVLITGCSNNPAVDEDSTAAMHAALKPKLTHTIATVSYPLKYLTQRIAGPEIKVFCPGRDEVKGQSWQPSPADVLAMQAADLIVANGPGAPYADWLNRVSVSDEKICNSASELATRDFIMVKDHKIVHQHGPEGEHSHPFMVAHSWLDPAIAKKQAEKIASELSRLYPDRAGEIENNLRSLNVDLDKLSAQLKTLASRTKVGNAPVMTLNPSLKFLMRAAGIDDQHLLWFDDADDGQRREQFESALSEARGESNETVQLLIPKNVELGITKTLGEDYITRLNINPQLIDAFDKAPRDGDYLSEMSANIGVLRSIPANDQRKDDGEVD